MFRKHACQTLYQPASCWWFTTRSLWRHSIFTVQIIKIPNTLLFDFCMVESNSLLPLLEWEMLEQRQWDALISKYAFGFMFATPYSYSYPMHKLRLMVSHLHVLNDFGAGVCHAEKLSSVFGYAYLIGRVVGFLCQNLAIDSSLITSNALNSDSLRFV